MHKSSLGIQKFILLHIFFCDLIQSVVFMVSSLEKMCCPLVHKEEHVLVVKTLMMN